MSKLLLIGLNVQFLLNKCIVEVVNNDVVPIAQRKEDLYQMIFMEVWGADVANSRCLGHLNGRSIYALQSMVRGMNLGKTSHSTFKLVCKACTEGKQYAAKLGNDAER